MADECIRCESRINGKCTNSKSPFYLEAVGYEKACDQFDPLPRKTQKEIFRECDRFVRYRDEFQNIGEKMVDDIRTIDKTFQLFKECGRISLTKSQKEELVKLKASFEWLALSYYWSAVSFHLMFEDLWNANKPFVFS